MAIAAVVLGGTVVVGMLGILEAEVAIGLVGGGGAVAVVGWIDDHRSLPAHQRAAVHTVAAAWAVLWLGGLPSLVLSGSRLPLGALGFVLAVLGIVWVTNLYNFMDGIDGIAAIESGFVALFGGALLYAGGAQGLALLAWLVAAASAGFLLWNWSPAKIFMGDVGSGLLGFIFAVLAVASERATAVPLLIWLLLLGVFVFDATVTLLRRIAGGQRWYSAHRSHAYQRLVQAGWSHTRVSLSVLLLNVVLGVLAGIAWLEPSLFTPAMVCGLTVLSGTYYLVERIRPMVG